MEGGPFIIFSPTVPFDSLKAQENEFTERMSYRTKWTTLYTQ